MNRPSQNILAIFITGVWINASEFFRNEVLLKKYWTEQYTSLGLTFPSTPVNGIMWVLWGFLFSITIFLLSRKFSLLRTTFISWLTGFLLLWIVTWNLSVLPVGILLPAIPLSLLESFFGAYICSKVSSNTVGR